ncbi:DUF4058 family protein [Plectonema cf. radiosum LEGE 06105]|uniref:DUF4058 family protein n=1 Tax=Plectonema cf. radiosum LEGE 06105 TaxID=945769 RepID=A0A8J7K372_9CYAN|nr:DUF4058 family protein [Plectonema radiosum]MBE9215566.1 DUF4058 family protein [Plectonema cf. radiosum LEGE 06105]
MNSPFPGMNPYLENPELWSEVHHRLITAIAIAIAPSIRPKYRVAIEKRTYLGDVEDSVLIGIPDVAVTTQKKAATQNKTTTATLPVQGKSVTVKLPVPVYKKEAYLEIREVATGYVVTTLEVLSPTNKRTGKGRDAYEEKRKEVLSTPTHLVEIDLLRAGKPMQILSEIPQTDYRILVARGNRRPLAEVFGFNLQQEIPCFLLPLKSGDNEPLIDLQSLLAQIYEQAGFDLAIDYSIESVPPLQSEDKIWADALLKEKGLR